MSTGDSGAKGWKVMKKRASAVSIIGGADGPTSVFIAKRNTKLTLRQKMQRTKNKIKRFYVEKTLSCENHSMDEVMEYIVNRYGFIEVGHDAGEVYQQMRASCILQYAPELLGEYAAAPRLKSKSPEDVEAYIRQVEGRMQKATEIPTTEFDIDLHEFQKKSDDINDSINIVIEKKYAYIGGGASGKKRTVRKFQHIYKDVYRYYGITKEDKIRKTERYENVVRVLSQ